MKTGELFFALSQHDYARAGFNGTFADAHEFIADAFARGAIAAVARTERVNRDEKLEQYKDHLLLVDDAIAPCKPSRGESTKHGGGRWSESQEVRERQQPRSLPRKCFPAPAGGC